MDFKATVDGNVKEYPSFHRCPHFGRELPKQGPSKNYVMPEGRAEGGGGVMAMFVMFCYENIGGGGGGGHHLLLRNNRGFFKNLISANSHKKGSD